MKKGYIPLNNISYGNITTPKQGKIDNAIKEIRRDGGVVTPIYVGLCGDKYRIKEGHVRYLAACQCGLYSIPATFDVKLARKK